jgi:hypothetical protein
LIDARDKDAVFAYADKHFPQIFVQKDFINEEDLKKEADRRNRFLLAAGVAGLANSKAWTDVNGGRKQGFRYADLARMNKEVDKRIEIENRTAPIHIDIGGEKLIDNRINVNIGAIRGGEHVARLIARLGEDADLPFEDRSVDYVTMESTPISKATAREIARVIKPGGCIWLESAAGDEAKRQHQMVIDAVGARGEVSQNVAGEGGDRVLLTLIKVKK